MFDFLSKSKTKNGVVVVLDVGTASVAGCLVLLSENKKPRILYKARKDVPMQDDVTEKKLTKAMIKSLKVVVKELEKDGLKHLNFLKLRDKHIKQVFCFLASPWYVSQTIVTNIKEKKEFNITQKLLDSINTKETENFIKSELNENSKFTGDKASVEILDNKILQTKLNGYSIDNPIKYRTNNFETTIFISMSQKNVLDQIRKVVERKFVSHNIHFHSFGLGSFLVLRDIFKEDDFLFLDMGGEISDILFVKNGVLQETYSFPIGRNVFIKEIMNSLGESYETAVSRLRIHHKEEVDEQLVSVLSELKNKWIRELEEGMLKLSSGGLSPRNIFLMTDDDMMGIITKTIKEARFEKLVFPNYNEAANLVQIDFDKLKEFCVCGARDVDIFLSLETIFVNRLFELAND